MWTFLQQLWSDDLEDSTFWNCGTSALPGGQNVVPLARVWYDASQNPLFAKKTFDVLQLTDTEEDRVRDNWTGCWCLEKSGMPHVRAALHDAILSFRHLARPDLCHISCSS